MPNCIPLNQKISLKRDPKIKYARMQEQYAADIEVEKSFSNFEFPDDVSDTFQGDIMSGCWNERFSLCGGGTTVVHWRLNILVKSE